MLKLRDLLENIEDGQQHNVLDLGPLFRVGEQVVITNKYKGNKGTKGVVTKVKNSYTWIKDDLDNPHQREHRNYDKVLE